MITFLAAMVALALALSGGGSSTAPSGTSSQSKYENYWNNEVPSSTRQLLCDHYNRYGLQDTFDRYGIVGFQYNAYMWALPRYC